MIKTEKKKRVRFKSGDIFYSSKSSKVTLLNLHSKGKWEVLLENGEHCIIHTSTLRSGEFLTPICRTVYGTGYFGVGGYVCRIDNKVTEVYSTWANMIKRCYTNYKGNKSQSSYENVKVCEEWHNFQNFAKWYAASTKKFLAQGVTPYLDKDLKQGLEYSPVNCCILPNIINCQIIEGRLNSKTPTSGVYLRRGKYSVRVMVKGKSKTLGTFLDHEEALQYAISAKIEVVNKLADEYKPILSEETYLLLKEWKPNGRKV